MKVPSPIAAWRKSHFASAGDREEESKELLGRDETMLKNGKMEEAKQLFDEVRQKAVDKILIRCYNSFSYKSSKKELLMSTETIIVHDSYSSSSRNIYGCETESSESETGSPSYNEKISNAASGRLNMDDPQAASSLSRKSVKSEGDTPKPCRQKAKGCFGSLFSKKHNKVPRALVRSDSE